MAQRVQGGSDCSVLAYGKAGPSLNLGSAPHGGSAVKIWR
jgi:hypothetical protein